MTPEDLSNDFNCSYRGARLIMQRRQARRDLAKALALDAIALLTLGGAGAVLYLAAWVGWGL